MSEWFSRTSHAQRTERAYDRGALRSIWSAVVFGGVVFAVVGCRQVPSFPPLPHDAGIECDDASPCPSGQSCLQGICYAACDATHACGPRESCSSGVCIARTDDAGPPPRDAAVPDPCDGVTCEGATPLCRAGVCVQCLTTTDCGGGTPICDVGRGVCRAFDPELCAPCNSDLDCTGGAGGFGTCVTRSAPEPVERVCLPACSASVACPAGFRCDEARSLCLPTTESCTGYFAGIRARTCTGDADCPQIDATVDTGLVTGACSDDGAGSICHYACGLPTDCPAPLNCTTGFCRP